MPRLNKVLAVFVCVLLLVSSYAVFRLRITLERAKLLKEQNISLFEEKNTLRDEFQRQSRESEKIVRELRGELDELRDARRLKNLLGGAQERINTLTAELEDIRREKTALEQSGFTLNTRINNLTREYGKTLEELKQVREKLAEARSDKILLSYKNKAGELEEILRRKEERIARLAEDTEKLRRDQIERRGEQQAAQKQIRVLEKEKQRLESTLAKTKDKLNKKIRPVSKLNQDVAHLKKQLSDKEEQYRRLQEEFERTNNEREAVEKKLSQVQNMLEALQGRMSAETSQAQEELSRYETMKADAEILQEKLSLAGQELRMRDKEIEELKSRLDDAGRQLRRSEEEKTKIAEEVALLRRGREEMKTELIHLGELEPASGADLKHADDRFNKAYALYDTAKAQVVKFSEMLMEKEAELERYKQKTSALEQEREALKKQAAEPAGKLGADIRRTPQTAADDFAGAFMPERIKNLEQEIGEKEAYLQRQNEQIVQLLVHKTNLESELSQQTKKHAELNVLYTALRSQLVQITELLTQKEQLLGDKDKEILLMRKEMTQLRSDFDFMEKELGRIRAQQKRTLEELSKAAQLNFSLQQSLMGISPEMEEAFPERKKAEQLKQEVERMLGR